MSYIRNRKHASVRQPILTQSLIALAALGPLAAHAQDADKQEQNLKELTVKATADAPYKAETASSPKLTQPLLDTTQTITVIKKEVLAQQGAGSLVEALRNTPGITLQLGENGNTSAGDTFQMRGFSAQTSIFLDGIRDLGAVSRDVFNIEQIDVSRGPAGTDVGRGAAAGYINLASKLPSQTNASSAAISYDSGERVRATADLNQKIGDNSAFRINVLAQDGGQMGRKVIEKKTIGVAPSLAFGLGTPTRVFLFSQHTRQDGLPDGGVPAIGLGDYFSTNTDPTIKQLIMDAPRPDRENFYGFNRDYEQVDADMATVKIEHQLGASSILTNTSRYGKSSIDRVLTGINAINIPVTLGTPNVYGTPDTWTVTRVGQSVLQENRILANTTNVVTEFTTGTIGHTVSAGLEFMHEEQFTPTRVIVDPNVPLPTANLYQPNRNDVVPAFTPYLNGGFTKGSTTTAAVYAFDTLKFNEQWQINGGVRVEHYNTDTSAVTPTTASNTTVPVGTLLGSNLSKSDRLVSWKAGALYKPTPDGSIYLAYATSQTPPGSNNFALSGSTGNINGPGMAPQKTRNLELGTKWDIVQKKLAVTATLYRTENENEIPVLEDPVANIYGQGGNRRVQGLELGAVGQITPAWSVIAGFATMDAKFIEGAANTTAGTMTRWSPKRSANVWTTYKVNDDLTVGGGARYMSEQLRANVPGAPALNGAQAIPSYAVADALVSFRVRRNVSLQLNVYNVFDRDYVASLNNGGTRILVGPERSAQLTANIAF